MMPGPAELTCDPDSGFPPTARCADLHRFHWTSPERPHDGALQRFAVRRVRRLVDPPSPPRADEVGPPSVLHVSGVCAAEQLHPEGRSARVLWILRHHESRNLAHHCTQIHASRSPDGSHLCLMFACETRPQVGSKTIEQQVMLVENSYFPVILGRSVWITLLFYSRRTWQLTARFPWRQVLHGEARSADGSARPDVGGLHGHERGHPHGSCDCQGREWCSHSHQLNYHQTLCFSLVAKQVSSPLPVLLYPYSQNHGVRRGMAFATLPSGIAILGTWHSNFGYMYVNLTDTTSCWH